VVVGLGAALAVGAALRADTALACLAVALLLQVLANLANDLSDFRKGADTPDRAGPTRVAAAGLVTERQLEVAIAVVIGLAGLVGLWLVLVGGLVILALGALAIVAALAYTGGPFPYGYHALGEVFVFTFFGLVAVVGTAYLQALRLESIFCVAAIPPGALVTAILVVNNLRDIPTDTAAGKRTLAVLLGREWTAMEYGLLLAAAYAVPALMLLQFATNGRAQAARHEPAPAHLPAGNPLLKKVRRFVEPRSSTSSSGDSPARARVLGAVRHRPRRRGDLGVNGDPAALRGTGGGPGGGPVGPARPGPLPAPVRRDRDVAPSRGLDHPLASTDGRIGREAVVGPTPLRWRRRSWHV
jgi:1,4-dihydroxy-2-naphthoate octaprenyltransferase